jgi:hypothetical protein
MSIGNATRKAFGSKWPTKSKPVTESAEVKADRDLIAREAPKAGRHDFRLEVRAELERKDITPERREALYAKLIELEVEVGASDEMVYHCGVFKSRVPGETG